MEIRDGITMTGQAWRIGSEGTFHARRKRRIEGENREAVEKERET